MMEMDGMALTKVVVREVRWSDGYRWNGVEGDGAMCEGGGVMDGWIWNEWGPKWCDGLNGVEDEWSSLYV